MTTKKNRYKWQEEALKAWLEKRRVADDFLLSACPGAGKTRFAMRGARQMLDDGSIERVIAVTPSRNLMQIMEKRRDTGRRRDRRGLAGR